LGPNQILNRKAVKKGFSNFDLRFEFKTKSFKHFQIDF
jgi:hypothetical protein